MAVLLGTRWFLSLAVLSGVAAAFVACGSGSNSATASDAAAADSPGPGDAGAEAGADAATVPPTDMPTASQIGAWLAPVLDGGYVHGLVVGEIDMTGSAAYGYGTVGDGGAAPTGETLFQIDSVTKTFTGLWLATETLNDGGVALDEPVQDFLPSAVTVPRYGDGGVITMVDLATHTSGLPDAPTNLNPADQANPWAGYSAQDLYAFLDGYALTYAPGTQFVYSDVGEGLLGLALSLHTGAAYGTAIQQVIGGPLGLLDTGVTLSASQELRAAPGHDGDLNRAEAWTFTNAQVGAGGLWSTANDLLKYAGAQAGLTRTSLDPAIALSHAVHFHDSDLGIGLGLNWLIQSDDFLWHNGGSYSYTSFVGFDPVAHRAVIVLCDTGTMGTPTTVWSDLTTSLGMLLFRWAQGTTPPALDTLLPKSASPTSAQLGALAGNYALSGLPTPLQITSEGGVLQAQADWLWYEPIKFYPSSATTFTARVLTATLSFTLDAGGQVGMATLVDQGETFSGTKQ